MPQIWSSKRTPRSGADALIGYTDIYNSKFTDDESGLQNEGPPRLPASGDTWTNRGLGVAAGEDDAGRIEGKAGLMGVDVPLPALGRVYYFRSLRAGSPITIEAERDEVSLPGRILFLLLIVAAVGVLAYGIVRRRRISGRAETAGSR